MPVKVLIVEDVDAMRKLLEQALSGISGIAVSGSAANGWDARLEISRRRPDVILLDEILPGESGIDLLREFAGDGIPVLLITSMGDPNHPVPPEAAGRLIKPSWDTLESDRNRLKEAIFQLTRKS